VDIRRVGKVLRENTKTLSKERLSYSIYLFNSHHHINHSPLFLVSDEIKNFSHILFNALKIGLMKNSVTEISRL
jgi:hypothetical protein